MLTQETKEKTCPVCLGEGRVPKNDRKGGKNRTVKCYHCRGTGKSQAGYSTK